MFLITIECSWNCQSSANQDEQQNGGIPFQTGEVQQGIPRNLGSNPYMSPYVETVSCRELFPAKILNKSSQGLTKVIFFTKTSKWEKWWSWWLRMTNTFILCNLLWKVQKSLAANRKGSFNNRNGTFVSRLEIMWRL